MSSNAYDHAISCEADWPLRQLTHSELAHMFEQQVIGLFKDIVKMTGLSDSLYSEVTIEDLRSALNNHAREPGSWWPPVDGPVKRSLDWFRQNMGLSIQGRVSGDEHELWFTVRSETLELRLARAFDPAPEGIAHIDMKLFSDDIEFTSICMPWLDMASPAELTLLRTIAQEWRTDWAMLLEMRVG